MRVCVCLLVEMGDKSTVHQQKQPPYDGLCNYAQKITSCFGLDGKHCLRHPSVFVRVIYVFISIGGLFSLCLRLVGVHVSLFSFVRELSLICALELDQFSSGEMGRFAVQQRDLFSLYLCF